MGLYARCCWAERCGVDRWIWSELARPAAEAALENWAAEVLAYVGLMLERERPDWTARFAVTVSPLDI